MKLDEKYLDLFDEDGGDLKAVNNRAERIVAQMNDTKLYTASLIERQINWYKEDLKEINATISELRRVLDQKQSPILKKLLNEKKEEKQKTSIFVKANKKRLQILKHVLDKSVMRHKKVALKTKTPPKRTVKTNHPNYIG